MVSDLGRDLYKRLSTMGDEIVSMGRSLGSSGRMQAIVADHAFQEAILFGRIVSAKMRSTRRLTASARAPGASVSVINGGSDSFCVVLMRGPSRVHIAGDHSVLRHGTPRIEFLVACSVAARS
jgi:hypothetical protein